MPCAFDCAIDLALQFLDICDDPDLRAKLPLERVLALRADENVRDRHAPVVGDAVPDRTRDRTIADQKRSHFRLGPAASTDAGFHPHCRTQPRRWELPELHGHEASSAPHCESRDGRRPGSARTGWP